MPRSYPAHCGFRAAAALAVLVSASCVPDETGGAHTTGSGAAGAGGHPANGGSAGSVAIGGTSGAGNASGGGGNASGSGGVSGGEMSGGAGTAGGGPVGGGGSTASAGQAGMGGRATGGTAGALGGSGGRAGSGGRGGTGGSGGAAAGSGGARPPIKKFVGNIDTRGQVRSDFTMFWDQVTPENAGKWGSIEGTRNRMNWSGLDAIHSYAQQHNIPFKHHNFIWGSQQPGWLGGLSQADQRAEVEEWIRLFCERYPDTQLIDVVNEPPPHTTPPYIAALGGSGASGFDWIVQAFNWAHQYCPNAILILNDYGNIESANENTRAIDMVNRIKAAGAPIHGIGGQAHNAYNLSTSTVQMYIDKLASQTGLPIYVSEYDINLADDTQQKNVMQSQFTMFWNDENVKGITLWGYIVGTTWEPNTGLMSSSGTKRPALTWLMTFLGR